ncbi:gliding motility-associated C-terminal domain-containing protein [Dyadobacter sp. CY261]|uniref:T9SS type B sorting domain-containing protein n=1 Tax=Dyadobacter sp. CY261 TaxID=2907203 RepID=UPI001F305025|nr:gliding motility-associated C-terminal domain-containing protein [Dyadobacter sp. CY261]MCF0070454.1 gliding motility-associated C-terminal domain-containing protein [Dyadobacter sp. CY261]
MMKLFKIIVLLCICSKAFSLSVMGSHLEWQTVPGSNDEYKVRLTLYLDATSIELEQQQQYIYLFHDDKHWETAGQWVYFGLFYLDKISSREVEQDTLACAGTGPWEDFEGQRHVFVNIYETTIQVPGVQKLPSDNGFIVAWHSIGTRDGKDNNCTNSTGSFEWVTTFIPPMSRNGGSIRNSSPVIGNVNKFFVCIDDFATIQLPAVDSDGDNLKYKLSKPYIVMASRSIPQKTITTRDLFWANGYTDQNQMHGNPALTINENTGELTVKPSEEGQYFIGISVDEYRNGVKIGTVNFYYTLTVVDCNEQQAWDKDIYKDTTDIQTLTICEGSHATLTSKQTFPNPQPEFQWTRNGKTIWGANAQSITISEAGEYQLLVKKINGCPDSFESETVNVSITSSGAEMDSIPPICDTTLPFVLNATPPGGTFTGAGVTGNTFDPKIAGEGTHEIQYVIEGSEACPTSVAKRDVIVSQTPVIDLVDILYASRDKPIRIGVKDSLDVAYRWTPPAYLNSVTYANPTCTPSAGITYLVTATNAYGCVGRREVKVKIIENILIPDAFTPNKDGINETWELKGIEIYPNCRVTIYNRWGEVIFHSVGYQNAFDGTVAGALQMPGVYAYKIRLTENSPEMMGSLTLIR